MKNNLQNNSDFWVKKKVLVTGHTGFKGSWLTLWLSLLGAEVYGISLPPKAGKNLFTLAEVSSLCTGYFLDIRDYKSIAKQINLIEPEIVFHLAAQTLVRQSYIDPLETYSTNLMGTANLLEALRKAGSVKSIVMVTTDKVYKNYEWFWPYRESDDLGGHDPYSASKAASELVIESYKNAFFDEMSIPVATARAGNVIGGGDWAADRLLPDAIRAWSTNSQLEIRSPKSVRPWQHVLDPLHGYLTLGRTLTLSPDISGAYNFGPNPEGSVTVRSVIEMASKFYGRGSINFMDSNNGPHEAGQLSLDSSKASAILGVRPRWSLDESVRRTINWYLSQLKGYSARKLCEDDIRAFEG